MIIMSYLGYNELLRVIYICRILRIVQGLIDFKIDINVFYIKKLNVLITVLIILFSINIQLL